MRYIKMTINAKWVRLRVLVSCIVGYYKDVW